VYVWRMEVIRKEGRIQFSVSISSWPVACIAVTTYRRNICICGSRMRDGTTAAAGNGAAACSVALTSRPGHMVAATKEKFLLVTTVNALLVA